RIIRPGDTSGHGWALVAFIRSGWANRVLAWEMAKRELLVFNKGTVLGFLWLVLRPLIQVSAYVVIVSVIFRVPFSKGGGSRFGFALYVLSGMVPWQLLTSVLQDAPSMIRSRIDLLRQVNYPLEIMPITTIIAASIGPLVSLAIYLVIGAATGDLHWSILLLPLPALLLVAFSIATAW